MQNKSAIPDTRHAMPRITPTCSGRRQEYSGIVVKALRQKRRSASPLFVEISKAGFYIEGCFLLRAAAMAPAEPYALCPDPREASAAAPSGAWPRGQMRGVITKHLKNKIETDLLWTYVPVPKPLLYKEL